SDQPRLYATVGGHRLGSPRQHEIARARRSEVADHANTCSERGLDAEDGGSGVLGAPRDDSEDATGVFVVILLRNRDVSRRVPAGPFRVAQMNR
ncbi:MAG: hypothetical protein QOH44_1580, partial [Actinomycetota bacterium]|nr:hypothetical protein [Actinomycetota bacterium]